MSIKPVIIPRQEHNISRRLISPNALRVLYRLKERGHLAYIVGGGVRDLLLGREPKDFDIATDARPGEIKKIFRNCRLIGRRFRLAHIHFHNEIIEVATFRSGIAGEPEEENKVKVEAETPETPLPNGESATAGPPTTERTPPERPRPPRMLKTEDGMILRDNVYGTAESDAIRRDFTVNALFYNIADFSIIDYVGGVDDLRRGLIRIIGDPAARFTEDPVRMVRAVRFAAMLGFTIEENTRRALLDMKDRVSLASPARMYEEAQKLFLLGEGEKVFQMLRATGIFGVMFPRIDEWLDTEADGFPRTRTGKALEWVDACVQAGRQVAPHALFALMFGQYIEEKADAFRKQGMAPLEALDRAVAEFMGEHTPRVQIPRKAGLAVRDILWDQARFEKTGGKYPHYFVRRPGFRDAFEYFCFTSDVTGDRQALRAWWKEFIKSHPPMPTVAAHERKAHGKRAVGKAEIPSRRRRRRRKTGDNRQ